MSNDLGKENAALVAMEFVEDGMTIGLGTGSTAKFFVEALAEEVAEGRKVQGVPTSKQTEELALSLNVPLIPVEHVERIHLTVDGADEADQHGRLIKGGGAALLREKIIANASDHMLVIADDTKFVETLGAFPLPVEVTPFGFTLTAKKVFDALCEAGVERPMVKLRESEAGKPIITDGQNYVLDCHCRVIPNPEQLSVLLADVPGVVEHGLFLNMARTLVIGNDEGATVYEF